MIEKALDLAMAVYRLTKLFPEGEVLIGQTRQAANNILVDLTKEDSKGAGQQVKILLSFFQIAEKQSWTKPLNFAILNREYRALLSEIERNKPQDERGGRVVKKGAEQAKKSTPKKKKKLSQRQKKILELIQKRKVVSPKNLFDIFSETSARTIRRDLQELVANKLVFQEGRGRVSFYRVYRTNEDMTGKNQDKA